MESDGTEDSPEDEEDLLGSSKIFQTDEERFQIHFLNQLQKACEEQAEEEEENARRSREEEVARETGLRVKAAAQKEEEEEQERKEEESKEKEGKKSADEASEDPGASRSSGSPPTRVAQAAYRDEVDIDDAETILERLQRKKSSSSSSLSYSDEWRRGERDEEEDEKEKEEPPVLLPLRLPRGWRLLCLTARQAVRVLSSEIRDCLEVIEEESLSRKKAIEDSDGETDSNAELKVREARKASLRSSRRILQVDQRDRAISSSGCQDTCLLELFTWLAETAAVSLFLSSWERSSIGRLLTEVVRARASFSFSMRVNAEVDVCPCVGT